VIRRQKIRRVNIPLPTDVARRVWPSENSESQMLDPCKARINFGIHLFLIEDEERKVPVHPHTHGSPTVLSASAAGTCACACTCGPSLPLLARMRVHAKASSALNTPAADSASTSAESGAAQTGTA
jgi:hypothetical protein